MINQPDLFDFPASPAAAAAVEQGDLVHWIVVTTKRARTGCGIIAVSYDLSTRLAMTDAGEALSCSLDIYSERVTCKACREAI
ncbi:hypothetical protein [Bradyrhizobium guangdongense]|uniref:hypothetical protein n=1 Tax=Bradyrhizobium guangdongense TaxID=1325090 RepID=UPI00131A3441|nr:hypothetical protein [Bradyrhizobium guangdongense]